MKKIVISGCSYSCGKESYGNLFEKLNFEVTNLSYTGQSNNNIIYKLYEHINQNKINNQLIICQLTWLHRFGAYNSQLKYWVDYQPNAWNKIPTYNEKNNTIDFSFNMGKSQLNKNELPIEMKKLLGNGAEEYDEMLNMYHTYLKYHYDEIESFKYVLYQIDTLKSYITQFKNKIIFLYWPIITSEFQEKELQSRNFFNIYDEYSLIKWSTKNNLLDGKSSHLSEIGHEVLSNHIQDYIKKYLV